MKIFSFIFFSLLICSSKNYGQPQYFQYENMSLVKQIISDSFYPLDVVIKGDFLLTISSNEMEVYNIDNPQDPFLNNKYQYTSENILLPKIEIVGQNGVIIGSKRIKIFDLSILPEIDFSNSTDILIDVPFNSNSFLTEPYSIKDDKIYYSIGTYSDGSILTIIDIKNPTDPKIVGTYTSSQRINGVINGNGNYLYLACLKGIRIMDVADSSNPKLLTIFDPENDYALGTSYNDYIIVNKVYDASLRVFDVCDSENPIELAYFYGGNLINHATIFNSLLHTSSRDHPSSLFVYDLEDLTTHMWKARFYNGSNGSGLGIAATQNIIYYCGLPNGHYPATNHGLFVLKNHLITSIQEIAKSPTHFSLYQNYPNPFNPTTSIKLSLSRENDVTLKIFNILGEKITTLVSDRLSAGSYTYDWDASNLASGVYLYRLEAGEFVETKKMVFIK